MLSDRLLQEWIQYAGKVIPASAVDGFESMREQAVVPCAERIDQPLTLLLLGQSRGMT